MQTPIQRTLTNAPKPIQIRLNNDNQIVVVDVYGVIQQTYNRRAFIEDALSLLSIQPLNDILFGIDYFD